MKYENESKFNENKKKVINIYSMKNSRVGKMGNCPVCHRFVVENYDKECPVCYCKLSWE